MIFFFMFGCNMKNTKNFIIYLKLVKNLCIFKLQNIYIKKNLKKLNKFEIAYKNNLLILIFF